jgi:hypothetical protein
LFVVQSLAEQAQARTGLLREAGNAHAEAAAAHEAKLLAEIAAAQDVQAQKEVVELKKKLEDAEQKAKDATADLQAVTESSTLPWADSAHMARSWSLVFNLESLQALERLRRPSRRSWPRSRAR